MQHPIKISYMNKFISCIQKLFFYFTCKFTHVVNFHWVLSKLPTVLLGQRTKTYKNMRFMRQTVNPYKAFVKVIVNKLFYGNNKTTILL